MNSDFRIEFQPQLHEDAVLRAITRHPEEKLFWRERNRLYELGESEGREQAFQRLHEQWFQRLGLANPLRQVIDFWPILTEATSRCLLLKARSHKSLGAELYLAPAPSEAEMRARRTIVVQLTPELLARSDALLQFLRHEFLHLVDMLDPQFGYTPDFPKTEDGPAHDHFLQSRYRVLWDITIDGRLQRQAWLPPGTRAHHFALFKRAFPGEETKLAETFAFFYDQDSHTHRELVEFAQHPENWLVTETEIPSKGRCAICRFPTFHLIDPATGLPVYVAAIIQANFPGWNLHQPICRQCADLYETKFHAASR